MRSFALLLLISSDVWAQDAKPRLAVLSFVVRSREVPARAASKARSMLTTELQRTGAFVLVEPQNLASTETLDALKNARTLVEEAKMLRTKKKFRGSDDVLTKSLEAYRRGAAQLADIGEVADALALQSAGQYSTGRDEEAAVTLRQALAVAPCREVGLAASSPLFAQTVENARQQVKASASGRCLIETTPALAPITFDGLVVGASPLILTEVAEGTHFWSVLWPNGERAGGTIALVGNKQSQIKAQAAPSANLRLWEALNNSSFETDALAAALQYASEWHVEYLLMGALISEGKGLALDSFLFTASTKALRQLKRAPFDAELLSAGVEFFNLAGELAKNGAQAGDSVQTPGPRSLSTANAPALEVNLATTSAPMGEGPPPSKTSKTPPRRVPLKPK
jgi:hypothetical protein